jgi:hypothetical protein
MQDGIPCDNAANCCTRLCVDLGSGTKVCQPAGGCRMTGDYCDKTGSCCGGTNATSPGTAASAYGVYCDGPGTKQNYGAPEFDSGSKNDRTCTGGQSCNPPGNICGGTGTDKVNASQNCCVPGDFNGSGKVVCKPDANKIMRCFGAPPAAGTGTACPTGYTGNAPCCIAADAVCQFRDQCCDGAPCVPDAAGILRCAAPACKPRGVLCAGAGDQSCCDGLTCTSIEGAFVCADLTGSGCTTDGGACSSNANCCGGTCQGGVCKPAACVTDGGACTTNTDCCGNACNAGTCAALCQPQGQSCTVARDCCVGLDCVIAPGATAGSCQQAVATCAGTYEPCATSADCCDKTQTCTEGSCWPPAPSCGADISQPCAQNTDCCSQICHATDVSGLVVPCSGSACFCDSCQVANQACSDTVGCCTGLACKTAAGVTCDATTPGCTGSCKPITG